MLEHTYTSPPPEGFANSGQEIKQQPGTLINLITTQEKLLDSLGEDISTLQSNLQPVLLADDQAPMKSETEDRNVVSPVGERLRNINEKTQQLIVWVQTLHKQLDL